MTIEKLSLTRLSGCEDLASDRMLVASRHAECLRRLSSTAARVGLRDLGKHLFETSCCIDRFAYELATTESGALVLARAAKLVATAEQILAERERAAVLH